MPSTRRQPHLHELGQFLRTRRGELDPDEVGIPAQGRRRVSGLRREEVASLATISSDYYTRIEQGRVAPSAPVLTAIVEALRLGTDQADYLESLIEHAAHQESSLPSATAAPRARSTVRPQLQTLLDQLTDTPAFVMGPRTEVLAWNALACRLYVDLDALAPRERNFVRLVFTHAELRERFADWSSVARSCVAILRREAVARPDDPALSTLVGELSVADRQFAQWWGARAVGRQDFGSKVILHPEVGEITLDWESFRHADAPEQQLILNSTQPGSSSRARLRRLSASEPRKDLS